METKGWIALDIDGTITVEKYHVPQPVTAFLRNLQQEGWQIALATGRTFSFASLALSDFDFPYLLLPQNGSLALEMPQKKILFRHYIPSPLIPIVEEACRGIEGDFLIYTGYEQGDFCYWRPDRFSKEDLHYLEDLQTREKERWREVTSYADFPLPSFPLIKCFGYNEEMQEVASRLEVTRQFQVAKIRDPFTERALLLVTAKEASKGNSLNEVFQHKKRGKTVIAAGDDENDLSLLQVADIKIAMAHAPQILQREADLIAPPTKEQGIIQALQIALRKR